MNIEKEAVSTIPDVRDSSRILIYAVAILAVLWGAYAWASHDLMGRTVIGFHLWQLCLIAVILCVSGLMSGLSGFGFSAVGSSCLLLLPPKLAVPLLMALSTANQFMSLGQLRQDMPKSWAEAWPEGSAPYICGGVIGVPIGIWLLNHLPAPKLMLVFGVILTLYSVYSLVKPAHAKTKGAGGAASGIFGVLSGSSLPRRAR